MPSVLVRFVQVCTAALVVLLAVLGVAVVRYRRREGHWPGDEER